MGLPVHLPYRADIDGLRAVAIIAVLAFHAFPQLVHGGFIGVDVFFVISGYLISIIIYSNLKNQSFSFRDFYFRRIRRIFPALLIVLVSTYVFGWFFLTPREYETLNQQIASGAGFISNFQFWRQSGYFDIAADKKPLLHLWSLAIEEQFYIFWPLLLWIFWKLRSNLLLMVIGFAISSFCLNVYKIGVDPIGDFYSPQTRVWELLFGAVLAYMELYSCKKSTLWANKIFIHAQSIIGFLLICFSTIFFNKSFAFPGWWALLPVFGSVMLISAGSGGLVNRVLLKSRPMVWVGLISYPLYLWHWPILSLARIYFGEVLTAGYASIALCASFVFAWLTYKYIEQPIRKSVNSWKGVFLLALSVLSIGLIGYATKEANGLPSRFNVPELHRSNQLTGCDNIVKDGILYPCTFGNPKSDEIILIYGDSHAGHLTGALNQELGDKYRFIFLGYGDCLQSKFEGVDKDSMCQLMWGEVRRLRQMKLHAVVHAQRWGDLISAKQKEDMEHAFLVAGLSPQKIAIVGSIPDVDLDCEIANYYVLPRKKSCPRIESEYKRNSSYMRESKKFTPPKNLKFFYPYEKLCPKDVCNVIDGSVANYWDDRHMSRDGALMATPDLIEYLRN
jgi:peptidoglycan/LPS O-acetylase OafA/YrhL